MSSFFFFFFFLEQQTRRTISPRKFPLFLLLIESSKKINENTGIKRADSVENYINKGKRRLGEGKKNFEEKRVLKLGDEGSIVTNRDTVRTIDEKRNRERNAIESERVARETTPTGLCKMRIVFYVTNESEKKSRRYWKRKNNQTIIVMRASKKKETSSVILKVDDNRNGYD